MSSRRPLQPIPAQSVNVSSTRYGRSSSSFPTTTPRTTTTAAKAADGTVDMEAHAQDDMADSGSAVSGLTSLEGDDEFERLMIQNARDERRLNEARHGRAQPFRKARTQARVGLTMDNLERNEAQHSSGGPASHARAAVKSPPSSSASTHSDPAVHVPASWGRKARTSTSWMRTITRSEQSRQTPAPPDETPMAQHGYTAGSAPRRSVEDSPLSHKSFQQGTPRRDSTGELDLTFDMNEASMLASTPYMPRNTKLDDIREREIESLREQGVATARLDSIQHGSPVRRLRKRTNSWQSLTKSPPDLAKENSPIAVYRKSVETVGLVERDVVARAERQPARPFSTRRTDSQDLLRRLARVSNTPSPKGPAQAPAPAPAALPPPPPEAAPARPYADPASPPHSSSQTPVTDAPAVHSEKKERPAADTQSSNSAPEPAPASQGQPHRQQRHDTPHDGTTPDVPSSAPTAEDIDATPMPVEHTVLNPKTPYVMGGWVDTPGPRTSHKPTEHAPVRSPSPKRDNLSESVSLKPPTNSSQPSAEQSSQSTQQSPPRPQLPSSALHALVQEARATHDYGDDTLHSLEDLIAPFADNDVEDDTIQSLEVPTSPPRSEAERVRRAERDNIYRLEQHARSMSKGIRDSSRGMRRLSLRLEQMEAEAAGEKTPVMVHNHSSDFSPWVWFRSFFWDERLKTRRLVDNAPLRMWGGVTLLGILLTLTFIWWASETVACEIYCHPEYASYSPYPFAVNMDAPQRGVVIPTLVYRALFKSWSVPIVSPIVSLMSWVWTTLRLFASGVSMTGVSRASHETVAHGGPAMAAHTQATWKAQEDVLEEENWDWSMAEDEVLRR